MVQWVRCEQSSGCQRGTGRGGQSKWTEAAGQEEHIKGSIEVGKLAGLVVWSQDPYTAPMKDFWQIPTDMTLVGGQVVHPRS